MSGSRAYLRTEILLNIPRYASPLASSETIQGPETPMRDHEPLGVKIHNRGERYICNLFASNKSLSPTKGYSGVISVAGSKTLLA